MTMWTNGTRFPRDPRDDESPEGFQLSPCLTASSGLLTPPSSYNIEARRNSAASSLSSLGPSTPIYTRFPDHGFPTNVSAIEPCQDHHSLDALTMGAYSFKTPGGHDGSSSFDNWSALVHPTTFDNNQGHHHHQQHMRMHPTFVSQPAPALMHSPLTAYSSIASQSSSVPVSCPTSSFSTGPFADYHPGPLHDETHNGQAAEGSIWSSYQYNLSDMMPTPTMAPNESLLGGEYVQVDNNNTTTTTTTNNNNNNNHDADMSSYDDVDVPLAQPSPPQDVVVKTEDGETSADERRRVKRSIWTTSTGGKSVKKEEHSSGMIKKKSRKPRSRAIPRLRDEHFEIWMDDDVEQIPGTKKWRRNGGETCGKPQICKIEVSGMPCGRKFRRQEHLHRHEKTHSGRKDYVCQLCQTQFNRNDNCWEHYWTHVHRPGRKNGRNKKQSLKRVLTFIQDPKHREKLLNKWRKEVGYDYDDESDPQAQDEDLHMHDHVVASSSSSSSSSPDIIHRSAIKQGGSLRIRSKL
ncbi:hypothetical protein ACEQ8H_006606 [Pleosporales sp. CAS-2024a]